MSITAIATIPSAYVPLRLARKPVLLKVAAVLAATLFLTVCSWISVPMIPVPITMQTFGVTIVGALFGWQLGGLAVLAWLAEAATGLPVLSGGAGGLAYLMGPTAGYLASFVIVAAAVGWCAERGVTSRALASSFTLMLAANILMVLIGAAWLAEFVGPQKAVALGVTPFLLGGFLKSALAAASIEAARRHLPFSG